MIPTQHDLDWMITSEVKKCPSSSQANYQLNLRRLKSPGEFMKGLWDVDVLSSFAMAMVRDQDN